MAVKARQAASFLTRRPRTIRCARSMRVVEADPPIPRPRHELGKEWMVRWRTVEFNPTISHRREYHPGENVKDEGLRKFQGIVVPSLVLCLAACAGPEPMLRSNAKFQLQGRKAAKLEVIMTEPSASTQARFTACCHRKAGRSSRSHGHVGL